MKTITRVTFTVVIVLAAIAVGVVAFAWSGIYNIAADDAHLAPTHALLETLRERSIESRAAAIEVPDLDDAAKATQGAGNYNAMCVGCHLGPDMGETEMSQGLYPAPPNLHLQKVDSAAAFWSIKHGIKASGMPAWGPSMDDAYIWNMVAFLKRLPMLDRASYDDMVARSGGHSHGGGETQAHPHGDKVDSAHDASEPHEHADAQPHDHGPASASVPDVVMQTHRHADGTVESHPVKATPPTHADDGHSH